MVFSAHIDSTAALRCGGRAARYHRGRRHGGRAFDYTLGSTFWVSLKSPVWCGMVTGVGLLHRYPAMGVGYMMDPLAINNPKTRAYAQ